MTNFSKSNIYNAFKSMESATMLNLNQHIQLVSIMLLEYLQSLRAMHGTKCRTKPSRVYLSIPYISSILNCSLPLQSIIQPYQVFECFATLPKNSKIGFQQTRLKNHKQLCLAVKV